MIHDARITCGALFPKKAMLRPLWRNPSIVTRIEANPKRRLKAVKELGTTYFNRFIIRILSEKITHVGLMHLYGTYVSKNSRTNYTCRYDTIPELFHLNKLKMIFFYELFKYLLIYYELLIILYFKKPRSKT
jgi:hypothetical protein